MAVKKIATIKKFICHSTDSKPSSVAVGSEVYEYNTGKTFVTYDGTNWTQK